MYADKRELIGNIDKVHTTQMGLARIKSNLSLKNDDAVELCKSVIMDKNSSISRKGKNWYIVLANIELTVNAHSFTIITAHTRS